MTDQLFAAFDQVRIINLVDRPDRRREMLGQLSRVGELAAKMSFYEARRPHSAGGFPSLGARGCFESHLDILRQARDASLSSLVILEDDFDFYRKGWSRGADMVSQLFQQEWDLFYGAHLLHRDEREGLVQVSADEPIMTTSFVAFHGRVLPDLVLFLEGVLGRPPGSPDYGPMHVDGAYTVFRKLHPQRLTYAAMPSLGTQRSSPSDVTPSQMLLDRCDATRAFAGILRRAHNWLNRL